MDTFTEWSIIQRWQWTYISSSIDFKSTTLELQKQTEDFWFPVWQIVNPKIVETEEYREAQLIRAEVQEQEPATGVSTGMETQTMMDGLLEDRCGQSQEVKTPACSVTEGFSHYQSFHSRSPARFSGCKLDRTLLEHLAGGGENQPFWNMFRTLFST